MLRIILFMVQLWSPLTSVSSSLGTKWLLFAIHPQQETLSHLIKLE